MRFSRSICALALALFSSLSCAHFQLIYTPVVNLPAAAEVPLRLLFWHPMSSGAVMRMGPPEAFYMVHRGRKVDLLAKLQPIEFRSPVNAAGAFRASVMLKRLGDYVFVLVPEPYFEESEHKYIQQITKSFVNRGGVPSGWAQPLGLATEIIPMTSPTNVLAGSTFRGRVLAHGKPVAGAELEVEYLAAPPDLRSNSAGPPSVAPMPGGAITLVADDLGYFVFGVPRAGFWGFAALGTGPRATHAGKPLSQDAVLWIRAHALEGLDAHR